LQAEDRNSRKRPSVLERNSKRTKGIRVSILWIVLVVVLVLVVLGFAGRSF
jgi:predicted nucleic acid-binding Zn ribbon protein